MSSIIERPWSEDGWKELLEQYSAPSGSRREKKCEELDMGTAEEKDDGKAFGAALLAAAGVGSWMNKKCPACDTDEHSFSECRNMFFVSVPKGASINPRTMILCDNCHHEMMNDLMCPQCRRQTTGYIMPNLCDSCGEIGVDPETHVCKHRELTCTDDVMTSDYEPSSPSPYSSPSR